MTPSPDAFRLDGRVALVTGASSGIGRAIAEGYAAAGAAVVLTARRERELEAAASAIRAAGGRAATVAADLADRAGVAHVAREAARSFGAPAILVNAAGINIRKPMLELGADDWDVTMAVNLAAPFFLSQALVPAMIGAGYGRLIHIASQQSIRAFNNSGAYGASKGALAALTRSQAEAWSKQGVTANAIGPGYVLTPMTEALLSDPVRGPAAAARTLIGRNSVPGDLVGAAVFLASPAAAYVTGQVLFVDGGFSVT